MGVKNVNMFEQHVEKIVLAVAAAGTLFMMYLAVQKVTIPGTEIGPKEVETEISTAIDKMDAEKEKLERAGKPAPVVFDQVRNYQDLARNQPLEAPILATPIPSIAPRNLAPTNMGLDDGPKLYQAITPDPVAPMGLHAEAVQMQVSTVPPQVDPLTGAVTPIQPGMQLVVHSTNVVVIEGFVPVGKMKLQMVSITDPKQRLSENLQRGLVYRIEVTRSEQLPNGWSDYKVVPPAKGSVAPVEIPWKNMADGDLAARMADVDLDFKQIMLPDFYRDAAGLPVPAPILSKPVPPAIDALTQQLNKDIGAAMTGTVQNGFRPAAPVPGVVPPPGGMAAPLPTVDQIKSLEVQPFTFWDETVQANHTYRYKVEVKLINPTYGWNYGLAKPNMKTVPLLSLGAFPEKVGMQVVVHSDLGFFIQGYGGLGGTGIFGKIFKQENGRWYDTSFTTPLGASIAGQIKTAPGATSTDVDTNFSVVDYQESPDHKGVRVVLRDPAGNLVTRDSEEWTSFEKNELDAKVKAGAAAAATAPADPLATTPPVTTPTPTTPGRSPTVTPVRTPTPTPPAPTPPPPARGPVLVNPPRPTTPRGGA